MAAWDNALTDPIIHNHQLPFLLKFSLQFSGQFVQEGRTFSNNNNNKIVNSEIGISFSITDLFRTKLMLYRFPIFWYIVFMEILIALKIAFNQTSKTRRMAALFDQPGGYFGQPCTSSFFLLLFVNVNLIYFKVQINCCCCCCSNLFPKNWFNFHIDHIKERLVKRQMKMLGMIQEKKNCIEPP